MRLRLAKKIMVSSRASQGQYAAAWRRIRRTSWHKTLRAMFEAASLTCEGCGRRFLDRPYPANGVPRCDKCLQADYDAAEPVPLSEERIREIVAYAISGSSTLLLRQR